jgi:hypothetical protein
VAVTALTVTFVAEGEVQPETVVEGSRAAAILRFRVSKEEVIEEVPRVWRVGLPAASYW